MQAAGRQGTASRFCLQQVSYGWAGMVLSRQLTPVTNSQYNGYEKMQVIRYSRLSASPDAGETRRMRAEWRAREEIAGSRR